MNSNQPFVSIVIIIDTFLSEELKQLDSIEKYFNANYSLYEIILIANGVTNSEYLELRKYCEKCFGYTKLIRNPHVQPIEFLQISGLKNSIGDIVFCIKYLNGDLLPENFKEIQNRLDDGHDIVIATNNKDRSPISKLFFKFFNSISSIPCRLASDRVLAVSRRAISSSIYSRTISRNPKAELLQSLYPFSIVELNFSKIIKKTTIYSDLLMALTLLVYYSPMGKIVSLVLFVNFFILGIGTSIYALYSYFTVEGIASGWTSMIIINALSFSGLFLLMAMMFEYIKGIHTENKSQNTSPVESFVNTSKSS